MNADRYEFCDTNIIVYAHDLSAGEKRIKARLLLERLWQTASGAISIQMLQELFVTLTRKAQPRLNVPEALEIVRDMAAWRVVEPAKQDVLEAIEGSARWGISFWDAMVVTAAHKAGSTVLWSEDLNDSQSYDGVTVRNPFA